MSQVMFGLPLNQPSHQTILPLITDSGRLYGFFPIAANTFTGTETSYTVAPGVTVSVTSVTLPPMNQTNVHMDGQRAVSQYMAAYFPVNREGTEPWRQYSTLISIDPKINNLNIYDWWSQPGATWVHHFSRGVYLNALEFRLDPSIPIPPTTSGPNVTTPQSLTWAASVNLQSLQTSCPFIDFNWLALFQSSFAQDLNNPQGTTFVPVQIQPVTNPPGGYLKAAVVTGVGGSMGGEAVPGGGIVFNTVRILALRTPPAGSYPFTFNVFYSQAGIMATSPVLVTLNLTVV